MRTLLAILLGGSVAMGQKPVDTAQLPMSAERKIDFATDIQPLLKRSCLKSVSYTHLTLPTKA